jgi:hypothetical protein
MQERVYQIGSLLSCKTTRNAGLLLLRNGGVGRKLGAQAPLQFLAHVGNFHSGHNDEFARQHFARLIVVRELAGNATILAVLIPAKTAVRNGFRTDELEATEKRIALRDLEFLAHDDDINEFFVRTKGFRHDEALSFANGAECGSPEAWATRCMFRVERGIGRNNQRFLVEWRMWYGGWEWRLQFSLGADRKHRREEDSPQRRGARRGRSAEILGNGVNNGPHRNTGAT